MSEPLNRRQSKSDILKEVELKCLGMMWALKLRC